MQTWAKWLLPRRGPGQNVEIRGTHPDGQHQAHPWHSAVVVALLLAVLLPAATGRAAPPPYSWSATGSMAVARAGQTATLLPNGKVLVAGGGTASAELYDPATGAWMVTGAMSVARTNQTATLLRDGTVLVAGGCCSAGGRGQASAEIYSPRSGTWTATGTMTMGRQGHTATLLPSGQVLVAGGACLAQCDAGSFLNTLRTAELYNPQTRTWTATGSMSYPREFHTASLLPGGQVLVAGGFAQCDDDSCSDDASAELYSPSTGTWATTGAMLVSREHHTATLLQDGRVLVAGGLHEVPEGGGTGNVPLASAELYDPTTGVWSTTATMATARVAQTATLLHNGQVLVAGGGITASELYQPQRGIWVSTGPLTTARTDATATLLPDGTVLVAGGSRQGVALSSAEVFTPGPGPLVSLTPTRLAFPSQLIGSSSSMNITLFNAGSANLIVNSAATVGISNTDFIPTTSCTAAPVTPGATCTVAVRFAPTSSGPISASLEVSDNAPLNPQAASVSGYGAGPNTWSPTGSLNVGRVYQVATMLSDGRVLEAGGQPPTDALDFLSSAELYAPATGAWTPTGSLNTGRDHATATLLPDGDVLVAGGDGPTYIPLASAELYHPATGTWTFTGSMHNSRVGHTATLLPNGQVLVASGDATGTSAELYNPSTGAWTTTSSMAVSHAGGTATLLETGKVLVAGGGATGTSAELYNPSTGAWTTTGSLNVGRTYHTATLLPSGQVLVAGGYQTCCNTPVASAELYDPTTGTWVLTGSLNVGRAHHTATLSPSGQVLVAGGYESPCCTTLTNSAELYSPATGAWAPASPMTYARQSHTATLLTNGSVLVAGGDATTGATAELYTPSLLAVTPTSGPVGQPIVLSGSGFYANEPIQVYWDSASTPLVRAMTGVTGAFTVDSAAPTSSGGLHKLIAVGGHSGAMAWATFQVTP